MAGLADLLAKQQAAKQATTGTPGPVNSLSGLSALGALGRKTETPTVVQQVNATIAKQEDKPVVLEDIDLDENDEEEEDRPEDTSAHNNPEAEALANELIIDAQPEISATSFNNRNMIDGFDVATQNAFLADVKLLYDGIEHNDLVRDATVGILTALKENEQLKGLLLPEDIGMMVRFLRANSGIVASSKLVTKTKRAEKKAKSSADVDDVMKLFDGDDLSALVDLKNLKLG